MQIWCLYAHDLVLVCSCRSGACMLMIWCLYAHDLVLVCSCTGSARTMYTYTVYTRYSWQGNHQIYGSVRCLCTVLANPTHAAWSADLKTHQNERLAGLTAVHRTSSHIPRAHHTLAAATLTLVVNVPGREPERQALESTYKPWEIYKPSAIPGRNLYLHIYPN